MEMEFREREIRCLRQSAADVAAAEQTLELRLPENMPPVGRVLGAWGQCILRGKEWQSDHVRVNGGVMVSALYESENGHDLQCVDGWIPFQLRWDLKDSHKDGDLIVSCVVREVDARQMGAEKLLLRASVSAMAQALEENSYPWYEPIDAGEVQLKQQQMELCLPTEAGERRIQLEEIILPPPGQTPMDRLLFGQLLPAVREAKILEDKLMLRGVASYHLVYLGEDGMLHVWDGEIPISQLASLEQEYGPEAMLWVEPAITGLEFTALEDGRLVIKAEILGQYVVYDHPAISLVVDAYCPGCTVELKRQQVMLPNVKSRKTEQLMISQTQPEQAAEVVDSAITMAQPRLSAKEGVLEGTAKSLYYDDDSRLRMQQQPVNQTFPLPEGKWQGWLSALPKVHSNVAADGIQLQATAELQLMEVETDGVSMVSGLTVEQPAENKNRPSLIVRRADGLSLWELAKKCDSTVEAIRLANGLAGELDGNPMLLIPVM